MVAPATRTLLLGAALGAAAATVCGLLGLALVAPPGLGGALRTRLPTADEVATAAADWDWAPRPEPPGATLQPTGPGSAGAAPFVTRVDAGVLIFGTGEVIRNGSVVFDSGTNQILFAGPSASLPGALLRATANVTMTVAAAMPGLWDCHTHFGMNLSGAPSAFKLEAYPANYIYFHSALQELEESLMMGITSVREMGGPYGQAIRTLERAGRIAAPNFHYAGRAIGMTGGHSDEQLVPVGVYRHMDSERTVFGALCDGVPECLKRVRENLRMQADVVKVMTTGGVLSEFDQPTDAQLSPEEIRAVVQDARQAGRAVAAHAHGTAGIQSAIDNGVTSVEHGSFMTREQARQIKARGYMVYTPTLTIHQLLFNGTSRPPSLDDNQWRKGRRVLEHNTRSAVMAMQERVPIVAGTDCPRGCALVGTEVNLLHMFGMTPLEAIRAATGDAPRCMGQYGMMPRSGRLAAGYEADVIALDVNPLARLEALTERERITHVWKAGRLVKGRAQARRA